MPVDVFQGVVTWEYGCIIFHWMVLIETGVCYKLRDFFEINPADEGW
jgi:hypothetical protein